MNNESEIIKYFITVDANKLQTNLEILLLLNQSRLEYKCPFSYALVFI
jgi:hypothetical protein